MRPIYWAGIAGIFLAAACIVILPVQAAGPGLSSGLTAGSASHHRSQISPADPPSTLTLAEYWQLIEETQELVGSLEDRPVAAAHMQLVDLASRWKALESLSLPDGSSVPIDTGYLVSQLETESPDLEHLSGLLSTLLAARETWAESRFTAADVQVLEAILARPEFQWQPEQKSPLEEWWNRLVERILQFVLRLLGGSGGGVFSPVARYYLIGLGIVMVALALIYVLRGTWSSLVSEAELGLDAEAGDKDLTADSALRKAQELSGGGDYRSAVRYLYLSSLLLLEERGLLRFDRSKTNREYLRNIANHPALAVSLREVVEVFDRVWYGYQPLDRDTYAQYEAQVAELRRQK